MRPIKFRAWDKVKKVMRENVSTGTVDVWGNGKTFDEESEASDCDFMQFVGWYDQTGKEIYDGDIVEGATENTRVLWEVVWQDDDCAFELKRKNTAGNFDCVFFPQINHGEDAIRIIGNVYENPELLQK